jgi:uncharacterized protein with von Willebrand factor type A (vWA) domain
MASAAANFTKKMQALRVEADGHQSKSEELQTKVKSLEQENLAKVKSRNLRLASKRRTTRPDKARSMANRMRLSSGDCSCLRRRLKRLTRL